MVLGFDDDNEEELDSIYFKKYFQRIQKLTGYINENRFEKIDTRVVDDNGVEFQYRLKPLIHFYGHSMDKTDGDIILKLRNMSRGFIIYWYNQEDYEQKVINLISVFGKEKATTLIQTKFIEFVPCDNKLDA